MKINIYIAGILALASLFLVITGCEYDVKSPLWDADYTNPPVPVISRIDPDKSAEGGVQKITIYGENFASTTTKNFVYFDKIMAETLSSTPTSITVRRPNLVSDSTTIKVVSGEAIQVVTFSPYKITSIWSNFGGFVENETLGGLAVDKDDNVYIVGNGTSPRVVYKITPDGTKTSFSESARNVIDAAVGPNNKLYLFMNNRTISQVDLTTGENTDFINIGKTVSFGDFDQNGIMYAGGDKSDLFVVSDNKTKKAIGVYASYNILSIRVFENYVYVLATNTKPGDEDVVTGIWKHNITDNAGTLGEGELVLDWSTTGNYAASTPKTITFTQDGIMLIATDNANPIMMLGKDGSQEVLYKDILPAYSENIEWGSGKYLYMILEGESRYLLRVDMGAAGAPYYGRQ